MIEGPILRCHIGCRDAAMDSDAATNSPTHVTPHSN
jgi:hypothetical protein